MYLAAENELADIPSNSGLNEGHQQSPGWQLTLRVGVRSVFKEVLICLRAAVLEILQSIRATLLQGQLRHVTSHLGSPCKKLSDLGIHFALYIL